MREISIRQRLIGFLIQIARRRLWNGQSCRIIYATRHSKVSLSVSRISYFFNNLIFKREAIKIVQLHLTPREKCAKEVSVSLQSEINMNINNQRNKAKEIHKVSINYYKILLLLFADSENTKKLCAYSYRLSRSLCCRAENPSNLYSKGRRKRWNN